MKRLFLSCFVLLLCMSSVTYAASIGNSIQPVGKYKVTFSLEDNVVLDKAIEPADTATKVNFDTINQTYGKIIFGLTDNINLYTKLGASDIGKFKIELNSGSTIDIKSNYGFLYGMGISGSIDVYEGLRVGGDLQYSGWQATVDDVSRSGQAAKNISGRVLNREYQATFFATKKFFLINNNLDFSPYLGARFSHFKTSTKKDVVYGIGSLRYVNSWSLNNKDNIGIVLGADMFLPKYLFQLNVEGRFIDETAVTTGLTYRY